MKEDGILGAAYVNKFKRRLLTAISIARTEMKHSDRVNTEERTFNEGDLVLALLPLNQPLQSRYTGPFRVLKRTSGVNYLTETPKRHKKQRRVHANLLKKSIVNRMI